MAVAAGYADSSAISVGLLAVDVCIDVGGVQETSIISKRISAPILCLIYSSEYIFLKTARFVDLLRYESV